MFLDARDLVSFKTDEEGTLPLEKHHFALNLHPIPGIFNNSGRTAYLMIACTPVQNTHL